MSKDLVKQQFGANAANYATSPVHAKGASLGRLIEVVGPRQDWLALDIATGAGHAAFAFAPHVAHVVASDLTDEMLAVTRKGAAERGLRNVETRTADAEALPFTDASFDLVMCRIAPHHFPDVTKFVAEAHRVLKPGGTFALVDNIAPDIATTPGFDRTALAAAAADYNAFEKLRDPSHGRALAIREWISITQAIGFRIAAQEIARKTMDFATWCQTMSVPAHVVPQLTRMLDEASPALSAFLSPTRDGDSRGFTLAELILIAKKP
jgi:ubiquinone/menaquinone biosynthesis C-methylase UbiE